MGSVQVYKKFLESFSLYRMVHKKIVIYNTTQEKKW